MTADNLWAPWRMQYIQQLEPDQTDSSAESSAAPDCFLCDAAEVELGSGEAAERFVLLNDERGLLLLNRYPYTSGHLLAAPREHVGRLEDLAPRQRADLMELIALGQRIVDTAYNPQGMNVGMNLGRCAGAGLPGHLHAHIVPRWNGDTNFMSVVGEVRVIPQALEESYRLLRQAADAL